MDIPNVIEKEFLMENIEKIDWKGSGTKDNPIIVEDETLPYNVIFKTEDLYIHLKDIDIGMLVLDNCQNIIIEDSIISLIKLKSCKNVMIKNNLIRVVKLSFSKNISIEKNRIYSLFNIRLFTTIVLIISLASGLLAIFSYIIELYLLQDLMAALLIAGLIILIIELLGKKSKRFLPKKFKKNEFLKFKENLNHVLDENFGE
ncbi:MAG: hypothetical protein EU529_14485 [Promethearchaeota archaeon]|nr:MAG: hypothetical protein EU529_14485 [Candidatus Lokiarchaeota archaeon]